LNLLNNGLVAQLPPADQDLLLPRCEPVELKAGDVLSSPGAANGHAYFPLSGTTVALVVRNGGGSGLAVGLAGQEGAVSQRNGSIHLLDSPLLGRLSCTCHHQVQRQVDRLFPR
jgi:hypothetical protein